MQNDSTSFATPPGPGEEDGETAATNWFEWVTEGLLIFLIGIIGLLGNAVSIWTFSKQRIHRIFHNLLLILTIFDTIYVVCSIHLFSLNKFWSRYDQLVRLPSLPYMLPVAQIGLMGSVYCTIALALERFLAVCYPFLPRRHIYSTRTFVIPVVLFSFVYNIPKFFELTVEEVSLHQLLGQNGTVGNSTTNLDGMAQQEQEEVDEAAMASNNLTHLVLKPSKLRLNPIYIRVYILWMNIFFHILGPFVVLGILNFKVYKRIQKFEQAISDTLVASTTSGKLAGGRSQTTTFRNSGSYNRELAVPKDSGLGLSRSSSPHPFNPINRCSPKKFLRKKFAETRGRFPEAGNHCPNTASIQQNRSQQRVLLPRCQDGGPQTDLPEVLDEARATSSETNQRASADQPAASSIVVFRALVHRPGENKHGSPRQTSKSSGFPFNLQSLDAKSSGADSKEGLLSDPLNHQQDAKNDAVRTAAAVAADPAIAAARTKTADDSDNIVVKCVSRRCRSCDPTYLGENRLDIRGAAAGNSGPLPADAPGVGPGQRGRDGSICVSFSSFKSHFTRSSSSSRKISLTMFERGGGSSGDLGGRLGTKMRASFTTSRKREVLLSRISIYIVFMFVICHSHVLLTLVTSFNFFIYYFKHGSMCRSKQTNKMNITTRTSGMELQNIHVQRTQSRLGIGTRASVQNKQTSQSDFRSISGNSARRSAANTSPNISRPMD